MTTQEPEWYASVPRSIAKQAVLGIVLMIVAFGGFGLWAFRAPLAAAVIAQGSFVATGQNKIVQHLEGGIIAGILVREGQSVNAGEPILQLDETAAQANQRELYLRQVRLEASEARLLAEYAEQDKLIFPKPLQSAQTDIEVASILDGQKLNFEVSRNALDNDVALLDRNIEALQIRASGYGAQLSSHNVQMAIFEDEFASKQRLFQDGLIRRSDVNAVERAKVEAEGQVGRLKAEIDEIHKIRGRYETEIEQARAEHRQAALDELQGVQAELDSIREKTRKATNVLRRSVVEAPVSGTVVRLFYHTSGGVIESGKPIAEILPSDAPLIIEVKVPRTEIDSVRIGQVAAVRLSALNQRTTPVLEGSVAYVSADAISGKTEGDVREVYVARISVSPEQMNRTDGFQPTPGMPAEVMIQTKERTFAQYLAKPIADSMARAFLED